ncbi:metal-sulfur cluster assembly factor [Lentibacillus salinarum]|uniref:Metal-sulfur cluster assembly factor n=1 Tax=Lentibacillus salinarum TaxID=446820 RepID=A0ABW3ZZ67_9BACI
MFKFKQVYDQLKLVLDPELDQSLVDLGFVQDINIHQQNVHVSFRLPTYWCSPNFAYIMGEDIRKRVEELEWVNTTKVNLIDHSESKRVSEGVSEGRSFEEMFGEMNDGNLNKLRRQFRVKAYNARQERLVKYLLKKEFTKENIITMKWIVLNKSLDNNLIDYDLVIRYRDIRNEFNLPINDDDIAFTDHQGQRPTLEKFNDYFLDSRRQRLAMEFNSHFCQGVLQARYDKRENKLYNLLTKKVTN